MTNPFRRQKWRNSVAIFPPLTWKDRVRGFFVRALRRMNPWRKPIPPGIWKGTTISNKQLADAYNRLYADGPPRPPLLQVLLESDKHREPKRSLAELERTPFQQTISGLIDLEAAPPRFADCPIIVDPNLPPGTGYLITADGEQRHFQVKDPTHE